jgi:hypothetical protein
MLLRLVLTIALVAACGWLVYSGTVTGWLMWLVIALGATMAVGTLVGGGRR